MRGILVMALISVMLMVTHTESALSCPPHPPSPILPMAPHFASAAQKNILEAERLIKEVHELLDSGKSKGLDVKNCEALLHEAERNIDKAKRILRANPIAANNHVLKAVRLLNLAIQSMK